MILECVFQLLLYAILCILMILTDNLEKVSLILKMSLVLPLTNDLIFLWYLDLAKMLALGLGGMGGRILDILARLVLIFSPVIGIFFLLNCKATHCQKVLELLSGMSLSHPEL